MPVGWSDLAFQPGTKLSAEIHEAWSWLLRERRFEPFLCSKLGDIFFETEDGTIAWLSCSAGTVETASPSRTKFDNACRDNSEDIATWFGPGLIELLHSAGKVAQPDECYAFVILPVFAECEYVPDNLNPVPAREVLLGLAETHRQIAELPDGAAVQMKVID